MLLSDARFAQATEEYTLAWQNLRPAPKVTIDFGNGRKLERTLKGSTVIYLCKPDGTVVDAYPGIYTPDDFLALLRQGREHLYETPAAVVKWHSQSLEVATALPLTVSKAVMQGPLLLALEKPGPTEPPTALSDLSEYPLSRPEALAKIGLPPTASGAQVVAADSRRYREVARPEAHRVLAGFSQLPTPDECSLPLFKGVLKMPLDDPYLGLKDDDLPGTP